MGMGLRPISAPRWRAGEVENLIKLAPHAAKLDKELGWFVRDSDRMESTRYRGLGLPVGSGPVEAACKSVVNHGLERSGRRRSARAQSPSARSVESVGRRLRGTHGGLLCMRMAGEMDVAPFPRADFSQ